VGISVKDLWTAAELQYLESNLGTVDDGTNHFVAECVYLPVYLDDDIVQTSYSLVWYFNNNNLWNFPSDYYTGLSPPIYIHQHKNTNSNPPVFFF
jgi:hypothetical protein